MRRASSWAALAAGLALVAAAPASATPPKHGVDVDTIATGLDNPRHVAVANDGDVYVAESGTRRRPPRSPKSCFDSAEGNVCTGATGAITRIDRRGGQRARRGRPGVVRAGRAERTTRSARTASSSTATTSTSPTAARPARGAATSEERSSCATRRSSRRIRSRALYGTLLKLERHGGHREIADLWRFENENNPDAADRQPARRLQPGRRLRRPRALLRRRRRRQQRPAGRALRRDPRARVFPNITMPNPFPARAGTRSRCRRCRPAWSRARTARST